MKLETVINSLEALRYLCNQPIKIDLAIKLAKVNTIAIKHFQQYEAQRIEVLKSFGNAQGNGNFVVPEKKVEACTKELQKLLDTEVDLPIPEMTTRCIMDLKIAPSYLTALEWLIPE